MRKIPYSRQFTDITNERFFKNHFRTKTLPKAQELER